MERAVEVVGEAEEPARRGDQAKAGNTSERAIAAKVCAVAEMIVTAHREQRDVDACNDK